MVNFILHSSCESLNLLLVALSAASACLRIFSTCAVRATEMTRSDDKTLEHRAYHSQKCIHVRYAYIISYAIS